METKPVLLMLTDVNQELLTRAKAAKNAASQSSSEYDKGRYFALYEVISLLVQQSDAFGVNRETIGLDGVDPERDLLGI